MTDAEALDWLDRLLTADEDERKASLDELARSDPQLHARLKRMLSAALSPEHSQVLGAPVLAGLARVIESTRALAPGDVLAGYRLIRELGRGGMSVVWLAERADGVVKRRVALKMPLFMLTDVDAERFGRERDALASLTHPHVARLYDAGVTESGQPFIAIEFVDGENLSVWCDSRKLDLRARLDLFLQVLSAVEHAHKHLVVHRDLKPSNIMVDGEGQVKLLDFGIAKLLGEVESAAALTQRAGGAMTPLYAAPEQIRGSAISTLTDVYSLGVVLHELLTGALPYKAARASTTVVEILESLARGELPRASQTAMDDAAAIARGYPAAGRLRTALAGDLDTIVGKALRLSPDARYASAAHFADDLRRYLRHRPIAARPPGSWYVLRLALRRHRLATSVAGVAAVMVVAASVLAWQQYQESVAHARRTAAVRDFMFNLVNDAEASEGQQGEVTGRQMLDGAVARARRDFGDQPQLQGELLSELGRMYMRLQAAQSAVPVLEESIGVLEGRVPANDPALNKSRVFLASALLQTSDDLPRIEALATAARHGCAGDEADCHKARGYASNLLSQLASIAGDNSRALDEMRRSVQDIERGFGARHEETALARMSLAIIARNSGSLGEAETAMHKAMRAAEGQKLRAADRIELERTMALVDLDTGHFAAARDRLIPLLAKTAAPAERALQLRLLANAQVELADGAAALHAADQAIAVLAADTDMDELAFARQARARGLASSRRFAEALLEIDQVLRMFAAGGRPPDSFTTLRAKRLRAEFLLRAGSNTAALEALHRLRAAQMRSDTPAVEAGLTLDLLGEAERVAGHFEAARVAHAAAHALFVTQLGEQHPFLVRNAALRRGASHQ